MRSKDRVAGSAPPLALWSRSAIAILPDARETLHTAPTTSAVTVTQGRRPADAGDGTTRWAIRREYLRSSDAGFHSEALALRALLREEDVNVAHALIDVSRAWETADEGSYHKYVVELSLGGLKSKQGRIETAAAWHARPWDSTDGYGQRVSGHSNPPLPGSARWIGLQGEPPADISVALNELQPRNRPARKGSDVQLPRT